MLSAISKAFSRRRCTGNRLLQSSDRIDGDICRGTGIGLELSRDFDWVLAAKGVLVGLVVAGSYLHDFVLGPGLARQVRAGERQSLRPLLVGIGRTNLVVTLAIPVLGAVLTQLLD